MGDIHSVWGWVAVVLCGLAGFLGVGLAIAGRPPNRVLQIAIALGVSALIIQVALGLASMNLENKDAGDQHVFYGIVISFTLAFAYLYRAQLGKRPSLYYGLLMLFMMGLGIRGIQTFGHNF